MSLLSFRLLFHSKSSKTFAKHLSNSAGNGKTIVTIATQSLLILQTALAHKVMSKAVRDHAIVNLAVVICRERS